MAEMTTQQARRVLAPLVEALTAGLKLLDLADGAEGRAAAAERRAAELAATISARQRDLDGLEAKVTQGTREAGERVAAERQRLQTDLERARAELAETRRLRVEEQQGRTSDEATHREAVAKAQREHTAGLSKLRGEAQAEERRLAQRRAALQTELRALEEQIAEQRRQAEQIRRQAAAAAQAMG